MSSLRQVVTVLAAVAAGAVASLVPAANLTIGLGTDVTALDPHQAIAGSASAILGTIQLAGTAAASALVGLLESGDGRGIACGYLLSAVGAHLLCRAALAPRQARA